MKQLVPTTILILLIFTYADAKPEYKDQPFSKDNIAIDTIPSPLIIIPKDGDPNNDKIIYGHEIGLNDVVFSDLRILLLGLSKSGDKTTAKLISENKIQFVYAPIHGIETGVKIAKSFSFLEFALVMHSGDRSFIILDGSIHKTLGDYERLIVLAHEVGHIKLGNPKIKEEELFCDYFAGNLIALSLPFAYEGEIYTAKKKLLEAFEKLSERRPYPKNQNSKEWYPRFQKFCQGFDSGILARFKFEVRN